MKALSKILAGAAGAAALAITAASPAQAQSWDRWDRDRNDGIDVGDILTGVAVLGGVALAIDALDGSDNRYDSRYYDPRYGRYDNRYGYGNAYGNAYGNSRYGYGNSRYGYGYGSARSAVNACASQAQRIGRNVEITDLDRSDRGYRVRGRIDVADYDGRGWNRSYDIDRESFTCYAANGRIYDFRV